MPDIVRSAGQALVYALAAGVVGWLSSAPAYQHHDPALALVKLALEHAGQRVQECRRYTPEELAALAPNMRRPLDCQRARVPLRLELDIDGVTRYAAGLPPTGIADDGPAQAYVRLPLAPGRHVLTARLRDSRRSGGYDYETTAEVELAPMQLLVIGFDKGRGSFEFLHGGG